MRIGRSVDREQWLMTTPTVNAYYSAQLNEIVFPAGRLQPPFFSASYDEAANYGGIGATVGHEMSHGFDDAGRQYDAAGNVRDWWAPEDARRYRARTSVVERQYSAYVAIDTMHLNGRLTLGENIADVVGVLTGVRGAGARAPGEEPRADRRLHARSSGSSSPTRRLGCRCSAPSPRACCWRPTRIRLDASA